jgi:hypothetical protein
VKTLSSKFAVAIHTFALSTSVLAGQVQFPGAASAGTNTTNTDTTDMVTTTIVTVVAIAGSLPPY